MPNCVILVGPPCSGKTTYCKTSEELKGYVRISQDDLGRVECDKLFNQCITDGKDVVIDRMGFNKVQRGRFISVAKKANYFVKVINFQTARNVCLARAEERVDHPTLKAEDAPRVIQFFYSSYEEPSFDEGIDLITNFWST